MLTNDQTVSKYIDNVKSMSPSTAKQYYFRLNDFDRFVSFEYNKSSITKLIRDINQGLVDPYG
jgi:hypothetical protein